MPKELRHQIENHLATFPERHNDVMEMQKEWKEFKTRALWLMVGFIGSILAIGVWVGSIQTEHSQFEKEISNTVLTDRQIETRLGILEVNNSDVRARLSSIEMTLQEIKLAIKELR